MGKVEVNGISERKIHGRSVKILSSNNIILSEKKEILSDGEVEMDNRASYAVKAAVKKAQICKKPVARYDAERRKAYMEFADGDRQYAK
jgi:hypothetical protein